MELAVGDWAQAHDGNVSSEAAKHMHNWIISRLNPETGDQFPLYINQPAPSPPPPSFLCPRPAAREAPQAEAGAERDEVQDGQ